MMLNVRSTVKVLLEWNDLLHHKWMKASQLPWSCQGEMVYYLPHKWKSDKLLWHCYHLMSREDSTTTNVEYSEKAQNRKAHSLGVGEACKAIFWLPSSLKEGSFDSCPRLALLHLYYPTWGGDGRCERVLRGVTATGPTDPNCWLIHNTRLPR